MKSLFKRETIVGFISSSTEAYNTAAFMFLAPLLAGQLFASSSNLDSMIYTYGLIFLGTFVTYPLGALYYGKIGDLFGRRASCTSSSLGLCLTSGMMGLIPLNEHAWIFFLILNGMQLFFSGGEYHSSAIFSLEHGKTSRRLGILSGLSCLFAVLGIIMAKYFSHLYAEGIFSWRVVFLVGFITSVLSFTFKYYCSETPDFLNEVDKNEASSTSYLSYFKTHKTLIFRNIIVLGFFYASYSYIFMFLPIILPGGVFENGGATINGLVIYGAVLLFSGMLADFTGITKLMKFGAFGLALLIPLATYFQDLHPNLAISLLTIFACFFIGPIHSYLLTQFAPQDRCRGTMLCSALTSIVFSGTIMPSILLIYSSTNSALYAAIYPAILAFLAGLAIQKNA